MRGCLLAVQYNQQLICDLINFTYWLLRWKALICEGFIRVPPPQPPPPQSTFLLQISLQGRSVIH